MKGEKIYENLEAAMDCIKAYNCMQDAPRAEGWLQVAIGWMKLAIEDARVEIASIKKEVAA